MPYRKSINNFSIFVLFFIPSTDQLKPNFDLIDFLVISTQVKVFISTTKNTFKIILRAESHIQALTSSNKSYVITKRCLKTIAMTEKIKWSQADLNR